MTQAPLQVGDVIDYVFREDNQAIVVLEVRQAQRSNRQEYRRAWIFNGTMQPTDHWVMHIAYSTKLLGRITDAQMTLLHLGQYALLAQLVQEDLLNGRFTS